MQSWPGQASHKNLLLADWWHGAERLQPGSASGTQAQESWHTHKLKKRIGRLRQPIDALASSLQSLMQSRLKDLQARAGVLPDAPVEPFPDKYVLSDSNKLTSEGRTSAEQYFRSGAFDMWSDGDATTYYAVRRTHATFERESRGWARQRMPFARMPLLLDALLRCSLRIEQRSPKESHDFTLRGKALSTILA